METFTRYSQSKFQAPLLGLLLFLFAAVQTSFGQIYAVYQNTTGTSGNILLAGVSDANQSNHSAPDVLAAEMRSSGVNLGLGAVSGTAQLNLKFPSTIPGKRTSYIRIDQVSFSGITVNLNSLVSILSLLDDNVVSVNVPGGGAVETTFARNEAGELFLAVTPTNDYTDLQIILDYAAYLGVGLGSARLNVYYAEYHNDYNCGDSKYTNLGESVAILTTNILSNAVTNPLNAIDDGALSENTASTIAASTLTVGLGQTLSQTIHFGGPSDASDEARVLLSFPGSTLSVGVLNNVTVQAYLGNTEVGAPASLGSLIGIQLLNLFSTGDKIPFYLVPGGIFDRIKISTSKLVAINALAGDVLVYDAKIVTGKPTISSKFVYQFAGATPNVTATSTNNNIFWQGPLPDRTNLNATSISSAAAFPVAVNSNGDFVAVSVKSGSCQTSFSDSTKLKVIVLTDASVAIPAGVASQPLASGGAIKAENPDHTFTYGNVTVSPVGLSVVVNPNTGAVSVASLPAVAVTTEYDVTVEIFENGVSTGLFLTKKLTVYPPLVLPGGTFPTANKQQTTFSGDIKVLFGTATGGLGSGYTYSLTNPNMPGGRVAANEVPTGFTLSTDGILTGNPSVPPVDTYTFPIYASDGIQQASASFTLTIEANPLPVKLTSFKVRKEGSVAQISWSTTEESNSDRFELERSAKGKAWEVIGSKTALGESVALRNYSLTDAQPLNGENLYRLKMIDRDGKFALSSIESITFSTDGVSVFPNPLTNADNMHVSVDNWNNVKSVRVVNSLGKIIFETTNALRTGIKASNLTSGLYLVQIVRTDGTVSAYKIVKQ
ncbi:T9SS type A sorting domain-containing protein [Dyadobacter sp. 32]|uniref:T9SS type A sorting domain-containing protein n=1 Tax=Dyadobacter sp. 32 TaxID=538966 RepID=UPI0011EEC78B